VEYSGPSEAQVNLDRPMVAAGSGTGLVATSLLAEAFEQSHPEIRIAVHGGIGSAATLRAVSDGFVAVGLLSRCLRDREKTQGLTVLPYARTAIVCGVHQTLAEDEITSAELVQIYHGVKTYWRDGREIVLLTREPGASSIEVLEQEVPGFTAAYQASRLYGHSITLYSDQEVNRVLARMPSGLGFTDFGILTGQHLPIKVLRFNGVLPTPGNIRSGLYPLVKTLSFAFVREKLSDTAVAFLEFAQSKEGEKILRANGYLPVSIGQARVSIELSAMNGRNGGGGCG
jgi:phosphate transport system substrate-binding protein